MYLYTQCTKCGKKFYDYFVNHKCIETENANSGYPLLADVLAELEKESLSGWLLNKRVIDLQKCEEVLSKYFS